MRIWTGTRDASRLAAFTGLLPDGTRAAFEFRHASWFDDEVRTILSDRDFALAHADVDEPPAPEHAADRASPSGLPDGAPLASATWGYLRLRRTGYARAELERWMARIRRRDWEDAFVFFKHEDEAAGPTMAEAFLETGRQRGGETRKRPAPPARGRGSGSPRPPCGWGYGVSSGSASG